MNSSALWSASSLMVTSVTGSGDAAWVMWNQFKFAWRGLPSP
jgi:hypothetical protein